MGQVPEKVARFLEGKCFAVLGVSRHPGQAANAIYQKLRASGYEVFPVNPNATEVEGTASYPHLGALPRPVDGVVIATHPDLALAMVRQCADHGVRRVWFHRSFGKGSVSEAALKECEARGIEAIPGGCPLMYCQPVDFGHRCIRWWIERRGRVTG